MSLRDIINKTLSEWMKGTGPERDIVLGSRVRLARNLAGVPFPAIAGEERLKHVVDSVAKATEANRALDDSEYDIVLLREVPLLERQLLVEKHLISPQHTENVKHKAVILRNDEAVSIMVNEEDHLRIQALFPGMQPLEAWHLCNRVDDGYDRSLEYAFSDEKGYLTSCPTNVGTGMRASIMVHLPALAMSNQIKRVMGAVGQFGLAVRGIYGEGTDVLGNIFQLSNQVTLGRTEEEIIHHLSSVTRQIIHQERQAREHIMERNRVRLEDRIWRSYGLLSHARAVSSQEAMQLLSDVRLGIDLEIVQGVESRILQELLVMIRPAHLQKMMGRELSAPERDMHRAALIRERLKTSEPIEDDADGGADPAESEPQNS